MLGAAVRISSNAQLNEPITPSNRRTSTGSGNSGRSSGSSSGKRMQTSPQALTQREQELLDAKLSQLNENAHIADQKLTDDLREAQK